MNQETEEKRTKALLLAGGFGTRLRPLTDSVPKCLVEIAGRPLLDYWFDALAAAGIRDVLINTHHLPVPVRNYLIGKNAQGFRAKEAFEERLLGSAGTITANVEWGTNADDIVIIYADNLSDLDIAEFLAVHRRCGEPMTMLLFHSPNPKACGIAELSEDGRIVGFEEKPAAPRSDLANAGVYAVSADSWREIAALRAFDIGFDVLPRFVGRMRGYIHQGYHRDIGSREALEAACRDAPALFAPHDILRKGSEA